MRRAAAVDRRPLRHDPNPQRGRDGERVGEPVGVDDGGACGRDPVERGHGITGPLLLWLASVATFGLPVSYDYNLIYLPLAAFAVCDRRDGLFVMGAMVGMLLWCQPFQFPFEWAFPLAADVLICLKLASMAAIAVSLARRAAESPTPVDNDGLSAEVTRPGLLRDIAATV